MGKPADAQLEQMVRLIQTRNRERGPSGNLIYAFHGARAMAFVAHSWAGRGIYFIDALAIELHPIMAGSALWWCSIASVASAESMPVRARFGC